MKLLIFFIILNIINVILQTVKSLVTNKGGKWSAAWGNAIAYGVYTVLLVYMTCDLSLWAKVIIVGGCNLVGVFVVKWVEEKMQKDRLWKIEVTFPTQYAYDVDSTMSAIPHSFIKLSDKHTLFNFYCATQEESQKVKDIVRAYNAKYFASEAKIL